MSTDTNTTGSSTREDEPDLVPGTRLRIRVPPFFTTRAETRSDVIAERIASAELCPVCHGAATRTVDGLRCHTGGLVKLRHEIPDPEPAPDLFPRRAMRP